MKTNDLNYKTSKLIDEGRIDVEIRLNDECKNGHQDFAITGEVYSTKTGKSDRNMICAGCIHDEILKHFPDLEHFIQLHLADYKGRPSFAAENGFHHLSKGFDNLNGKTQKEYFCNYYRVKPAQYDILKDSENILEYSILLKELGILDQWQQDANQAIKQLEQLTGNTFVIDSTRTQYNEPDPDQVKVFKELKARGYYTPVEKKKRANRARKEKIKVARGKIMADAMEKIEKVETARIVNLFMLDYLLKIKTKFPGFNPDFDFNNWIYYDHTNTIKFNWMDHYKKMSSQEYVLFCDKLSIQDLTKLPANISFEMEGEQTFTSK